MYLNKIDDPRDPLQRARQSDILKFARERQIAEVSHDMPAMLARSIIRGKGLASAFVQWARGHVVTQSLGGPPVRPVTTDDANAVNAEADLARQFAEQQRKDAEPALADMGINELRKVGKDLGIVFDRKDRMPVMREKIEAKRNG